MKNGLKNFAISTFMYVLLLAGSTQAFAQVDKQHLNDIINDSFRTDISRSRDHYRHPLETLVFFGIEPDMTVVELWPSGGWYTDIIAPYLKDRGKLIAAHYNPETEHPFASFFESSYLAFESKIKTARSWFGDVEVRAFEPPFTEPVAPDGTVDMVLSFRNMHNWLNDESIDFVLEEAHAMLKPGGILAVVDHRADVYQNIDPLAEDGYVNQQWFVQKVHDTGFQVLEHSEINANPLDTTDHPNGVWTLPPYLRVPETDDSEKYVAIGESDRFTIKFIKLSK